MGEILKNIREIHRIGKGTREQLTHPGQCPPLRRYGVWVAGISHATRGFHFVRPSPNMAQLLVCLEGRGRVLVDGHWRTCDQGMAYLTPAHRLHAYRADDAGRWKIGWAMYQGDRTEERFQLPPLTEPILIPVDPRPWEHVLRGLAIESEEGGNPVLQEHWTGLLHGYAMRMLQRHPEARLGPLWRCVQESLSQRWTLNRLSRQAFLDKERLRRLCHAETGRSPMQQVAYLRMQHAVSLLATDAKVMTVASTVGYENMFAFSTAFKRFMGHSPRAFRKRMDLGAG